MAQQGGPERVAVVGGGVLGMSTAVQLARGGARVAVVTDTALASGASGRSLSWLNSAAEYPPAYHELRLLGLERYRMLADRSGHGRAEPPPYLRFDGGLRWAAEGQGDDLRRLHEHQRRVGYPSQWITRREVQQLVPGVDPDALPAEGAVFNAAEGWVDLPSLVAELADQLVGLGGRIVCDAGRAEVEVRDDRVTGVTTASGQRVSAEAVVVATGADAPRALRQIGITVPDATAPALLVRTEPVDTPLRSVLNTPRVSLRPAPAGGLVMDAAWSEHEVETVADGTYRVRPDTVEGLLREASAVLAGHPNLAAASSGVGLKPVPGDGYPVLGPVGTVAGYHIAFTHSGATLGLIVGELLAQEILTGDPSPLLASFRVDRFGSTSAAPAPQLFNRADDEDRRSGPGP